MQHRQTQSGHTTIQPTPRDRPVYVWAVAEHAIQHLHVLRKEVVSPQTAPRWVSFVWAVRTLARVTSGAWVSGFQRANK